jgi:hypothetical protein
MKKTRNQMLRIIFALLFSNALGLNAMAAEVRPGGGPSIDEAQKQRYAF